MFTVYTKSIYFTIRMISDAGNIAGIEAIP